MASMPLENIAEVILTPTGDVPDSVGTRSIPITRKELVTVGRSSRNKTKNLQPGSDNAYFDSPVMSRLHSWIKCDDEGKVLISDAGSMHGTFLDETRLEPKRFVPLETGSQVRFGSSVTRGSDIFPPKAFDVKVVQNSRMVEIQHGYGITSDELILPDSPYYSSEDEEDDVIITDVKPINTVDLTSNSDNGSVWTEEKSQRVESSRWNGSSWSQRSQPKVWLSSSWSDEPPSEQPVTIVREPLQENVCIDLDPPSVIRDASIVDLTAEAPISQQTKAPGARISIPDLLAQERQEQSRRSSQSPTRDRSFSNERAATNSVVEDSDTQSVEDFDLSDEESVDEDSISDPEVTTESVPTSPFSPEPVKSSTTALPSLPSIQPPMPGLVKEIVPPEIQKAWNSTWTAAPYLSPFVYAAGTSSASDSKPLDVTASITLSRDSITNLANRTKLAMEQVRKAEAMRDRAQDFLRSRIEMQSSRSHQVSNEPETSSCAQQAPPNESTTKADPVIPFWVRNFAQGAKAENNGESGGEKRAVEGALNPTVEVVETVSNPPESRSPSPILKMAGIFQVSDDEEEEEQEEEQDSDGDSWMNRSEDEDTSLSNSSLSDKDESEEISDDDEEIFNELSGFVSTEEEGYDDEDDVDEEDVMDYDHDDDCHDTESNPSDDDIVEEETVKKDVKITIVQNPVKSAMSMENFFSPKDEEEVRSSQEDEIVKRWNAEIDDLFSGQPDLEIEESNDTADVNMVDPDLLPPANKKRKRSESEEIEEYHPHHAVASELEALEISTPRKIAPLPQRFLLARTGQNTNSTEIPSPREEAERKELLALASELKNELEAEALEPEAKRPRVQNAGATWGSTIATAMAGALIGGVGVFAALVATAGDM